ncbi:MAG: hypothetical protein SFW36_03345, partial [Leptolyngbyaceae cyanobacterium bins.59]|nr:hypothetical protein [Leptolyngbyaceae cyanobacterium bins.59]
MPLSIQCPSCQSSLGTLSSDGTLQMTCPSCSDRYSVIYGKLSGRAAVREPIFYFTPKLPSLYKQHYELRLTTPNRGLRVLNFSVSAQEDSLPVRRGDMVSILYRSRGYVLEKLISINNHTTGRRYTLPIPAISYPYLLSTRGLLCGLFLAGLLIAGTSPLLASSVVVLGGCAYLKLANTTRMSAPSLRSNMRDEAKLLSDQKLLAQKLKIEQRVNELQHQCQSEQVLIHRLKGLKQRMLNFDPDLYAPRINRIEGAMKILARQIQNAQTLITGYLKTLEMVEIEVETAQIADQLPDVEEFTADISRRLTELKTVEEENESL